MKLFFDTETSGFPDKNLPLSHADQPYIMQFAAILDDESRHTKAIINCRVKSDVENIAEGALAVHGIDKAESEQFGLPIKTICAIFLNLRTMAYTTLAYNIKFDMDMFNIQFNRLDKGLDITSNLHCIMLESQKVMKVNRWPKLDIAYRELVDPDGFPDAHDALADVQACRALYYAIQDRQG